jgi:hypothetical protein
MQTVVTVTDVTWLFAKEKFNNVVGERKKKKRTLYAYWIRSMRSHVFDHIPEESNSPLQHCENLRSLPELLDIPTAWGVFDLRVFQITTARCNSTRASRTGSDPSCCY